MLVINPNTHDLKWSNSRKLLAIKRIIRDVTYFPSSTFLFIIGILFCNSALIAKTSAIDDKLNQTVVTSSQCLSSDKTSLKGQRQSSAEHLDPVKDVIYLEADTGKIVPQGISTLNGNVFIQQNTTVLTSNNAQINRETHEVKAQGNVTFSDTDLSLKSPLLTYNLKNKSGTIDDAEYALGSTGTHGKSSQIKQLNENNLLLKNATFTSCPVNKNRWHLASKNISLDTEAQTGTAKNVTFNVANVPVFYLPWLKFSTSNQRLSGFLSPTIRLQSNAGVSIPYYINIAPNYDATVELTTLADRGFQIGSEFRYLGDIHQGELTYNLIPNDIFFSGEQRDYFKIKHNTQIDETTRLTFNAEGVSDREYFNDFATSLETSIRPVLQRRLQIVRSEAPWTISAVIENYQILDTDEEPYSKLPELTLNYTPTTGPKELKLEVNSELVYFNRTSDITGTRADVKLKLGKRWGRSSGYFKPTLSLDHTLYSLNNTTEQNISRTLPTLTLDGGLFFDRYINKRAIESKAYIQTLEPRLFYTYTPFKDQSNIPIFDTARTDFSESNQLFLENRFTGKDRIADTNQLTFAVSSRIQDRKSGNEVLKATIGQIFNFSNRKVTLPQGTILTGKRSDLLLELEGRLNDHLRLASTVNLKSDGGSASNYDLRLNYKDDEKRIANLSFRKLDAELEQVSFSTALPISEKWSMIASSEYDTRNERDLESLFGIEYKDCCWKTRLVVKRYLTSDNISYDNSVFIELELKGLGNIGKSATRQIKEKIYGYDGF